MLPFPHKIAFLLFAALMLAIGARGFFRLYKRVAAGRRDTDLRSNHIAARAWYALTTTLLQSRTFRKRPWVSFFHSFIFYGFVFYLLVNLVDAIDGFVSLSSRLWGLAGDLYVLLADILSALVLLGVVALIARRFLLPSRRDFVFNERTLLHPDLRASYMRNDSIIVSAFILFHVGSRAVGAAAKIHIDGPVRYAPFATAISHLFNPAHAEAWRIFGYWGALGSVLAFLGYFPYTKHIHIFAAPAKYLVARDASSGVLPAVELDLDAEAPLIGAAKLEDLAWPRLLDAYACIQCNRCQDVCPATATGKALSPSALEINKRMELNRLARQEPGFERGAPSPNPLLSIVLSAEAAWGCTTCGACLDICPVQDEPMLDIIDVRRHQVMIAGEFPSQLQTAFRGMERAKNPWGIHQDKRMDWAAGLNVPTTAEKPEPDVLFWVGCAASYDPQSQRTARAFVQLMEHAEVDFAVLGKRECCTGDSARRAGNELLYRQLAEENITTLNEVRPKLVVATCPHCMNAVGKEYKQLGGDYKVMHHTEYLESLVAEGKLQSAASSATFAFHDPCYLGRHNGVYDAPRNLLNILSNSVVELERNREKSFCCGAGGAQFWKEEEPGDERISDNRYREAQQTLAGAEEKVLAVGCPFCKSMLESTPGRGEVPLPVRDIAELLLEGVQRRAGILAACTDDGRPQMQVSQGTVGPLFAEEALSAAISSHKETNPPATKLTAPEPKDIPPVATRKKWTPKAPPAQVVTEPVGPVDEAPMAPPPTRKAWVPKRSAAMETRVSTDVVDEVAPTADQAPATSPRKRWNPKSGQGDC